MPEAVIEKINGSHQQTGANPGQNQQAGQTLADRQGQRETVSEASPLQKALQEWESQFKAANPSSQISITTNNQDRNCLLSIASKSNKHRLEISKENDGVCIKIIQNRPDPEKSSTITYKTNRDPNNELKDIEKIKQIAAEYVALFKNTRKHTPYLTNLLRLQDSNSNPLLKLSRIENMTINNFDFKKYQGELRDCVFSGCHLIAPRFPEYIVNETKKKFEITVINESKISNCNHKGYIKIITDKSCQIGCENSTFGKVTIGLYKNANDNAPEWQQIPMISGHYKKLGFIKKDFPSIEKIFERSETSLRSEAENLLKTIKILQLINRKLIDYSVLQTEQKLYFGKIGSWKRWWNRFKNKGLYQEYSKKIKKQAGMLLDLDSKLPQSLQRFSDDRKYSGFLSNIRRWATKWNIPLLRWNIEKLKGNEKITSN